MAYITKGQGGRQLLELVQQLHSVQASFPFTSRLSSQMAAPESGITLTFKADDGREGEMGQGQLYLPLLPGNQKFSQGDPHLAGLLLHLTEQLCAMWISPLVEEPRKVHTLSFHVL